VSSKIVALSNDLGVVEQLALFTDYAAFVRDDGEWVPVPIEIDDNDVDLIHGMTATDATDEFLPLFDMADSSSATLTVHDVS
jgi:hypothetical protein